MSRELLKRALDELDIDRDTYGTLCKEIETYLAQPEPEPEPAAWLSDRGTIWHDKTDAIDDSDGFIEPLYTTPPDQSARIAELELALARANADIESVEDRLIVKNQRLYEYNEKLAALQAKREPLSDADIESCYEEIMDYQSLRPQDARNVFKFARAIEAAHGIGE